ncbi:MAG: hypothetical protein HDS33_01065 [Bacteroides sp.]|nr:hypothetical protein [Bacteroides sp.]
MKTPFESPKVQNFIFLLFIGLGIYFSAQYEKMSIIGAVFLGAIVGALAFVFVVLLIGAFREIKRRADNGIDLTATLETDPEAVKSRMWVVMQFGHEDGIKGALMEFNGIFRNYPQWELENWDMFRAWYKDMIDHALAHPDIYTLTDKSDGGPYSKMRDPLYDPKAPDWEQFASPEYDPAEEITDEEIGYKRPLTLNERLKRPFGSGF